MGGTRIRRGAGSGQMKHAGPVLVLATVLIATGLGVRSTDLEPSSSEHEKRIAPSGWNASPPMMSCSTRVGQDFIYDLQYWHDIDAGIWDKYWGTWWVDYNCQLRVLMRPNEAGDYDIEVEVDPYTVRVAWGDTLRTADGVTIFGDDGYTSPSEYIIEKIDLLVVSPCGYWDPGIVTGYGHKSIYVLLGGACYGEWSVTVDLWTSGTNEWRSKTVHFTMEDPCISNPAAGGFLIGGGLVAAKSEYLYDNPGRQDVLHYAGRVRYYVSDREPEATDTVRIKQVYDLAKSSDSTYGSPYRYTPNNLIAMKSTGYGDQDCWPNDCSTAFSPDSIWRTEITTLASNIANTGCVPPQFVSEFLVAPRATKPPGARTVFGLSYTEAGDSLVLPDTLDGTVALIPGSLEYFILPETPMSENGVGAEICVRPPSAVLIERFETYPRSGYVELSWNLNADEEILGFDVYRRSSEVQPPRSLTGSSRLPATARQYADRTVEAGKTYRYTVAAVKADGTVVRSAERTVETHARLPVLRQNQPNPFGAATSISFVIPDRSHVTLAVYGANGGLTKVLVDGPVDAGEHVETWDGRDMKGNEVGSGVYFYRLQMDGLAYTRKMILVR